MTENPLKRPSGSEAALTEQELLEQLRSKDPAAQRRFYERYVGNLAAVCYRYVPEPAAAKDVLQESFIKIFGSLDRFVYRGEGSLRAWSTRIVVNTAINAFIVAFVATLAFLGISHDLLICADHRTIF